MSVQSEIDLLNLVAAYQTILSQKINTNINIIDIHTACEAIKLLPLYETQMTTEEKALIDSIITKTDGLVL